MQEAGRRTRKRQTYLVDILSGRLVILSGSLVILSGSLVILSGRLVILGGRVSKGGKLGLSGKC